MIAKQERLFFELLQMAVGEKCENEEDYEREFVPQKLQLELYYVNHRSFWYDVCLVAKTG